jgi:hypothetical protein
VVLPVSRGGSLVYHPRGELRRLWLERPEQCLVEGPAGTGKSRAIGEYIYDLMVDPTLPPVRGLVLRKTRASLSHSWLNTWETKILPPGSPLLEGPTKENRVSYIVPGKKSELVTGGMDQIERLRSTEFDFIFINEAIEILEHDADELQRALRGGQMPWPEQLILDTNPGAPNHWLNVRANSGRLTRIRTTHKDNPEYWDSAKNDWTALGRRYVLGKLARLPGVLGDRMYRGLWKAAENQVLGNFDPAVHMIGRRHVPEIKWTAGSMDFGWRNPGAFGVWGFDSEERAYLLAQVYRRGWTLETWADAIEELQGEFQMNAIICDSAEPRSIEFLNDRLGSMRGRVTGPICVPADKSRGKMFGLDTLRQAMEKTEDDGPPMVRIVEDSLRYGRDPELDEEKRPCTLEEEIPLYTYMAPKGAQELSRNQKEKVDDRCPNHACDMAEYMAVWKWGRDHSVTPKEPSAKPGTYAWVTRHWEFTGEPEPEGYVSPFLDLEEPF